MYFKQFYLGCLSHASYLIGSDREAVVVDPQRDVDQYIDEAKAHGLTIKHIIETHLHADFVSGHRELGERTGAKIWIGHRSGATFDHLPAREGMEIKMGTIVLRFLETPGHTPESISVLAFDRAVSETPLKLLTGDTLFIGDVGRPDLVGAKGHDAEEMASMMYESLHRKILILPDTIEIYPAHGAGSACGRFISNERSSTLGEQRKTNWALRPISRDDFVQGMLAGLNPPPSYFSRDVELNRLGAVPLDELQTPQAMTPTQFADAPKDALVLDVRSGAAFADGHVRDAFCIGLSGSFASWAGTLIAIGTPIVIVADDEAGVREATLRLARIGHEKIRGYLAGGMHAWIAAGHPIARHPQTTTTLLAEQLTRGVDVQIVDVRRPAEWASGHIERARHIPLDQLSVRIGEVDKRRPVHVICGSGYRSPMACSILKRNGINNVIDVIGGHAAWLAGGLPTVVPRPSPDIGTRLAR